MTVPFFLPGGLAHEQAGQQDELLAAGQGFPLGQLRLGFPEDPVELLGVHLESMAFRAAARQPRPEISARDLL